MHDIETVQQLMQRHPDKLIAKAKQCDVYVTTHFGVFEVVSPTIDRDTGERTKYYVRQYTTGSEKVSHWRCGCKWCSYHPTKTCAHKLAVQLWLAEAGNQYMSAWAGKEDAKRQHRRTVRSDDVYLTYRNRPEPAPVSNPIAAD